MSSTVTGLTAGATYHYRFVATNATGTTAGATGRSRPRRPAPSAYRDAVLGTAWLSPTGGWASQRHAAADEKGANPGTYRGGFTLGEPGALGRRPRPLRRFDGVSGEMTAPAAGLAASGTLEGWFNWRGGVAVLRDHTSGKRLDPRLRQRRRALLPRRRHAFNTGRTTASVRGAWHHVAVTKNGGNVSFYLDGPSSTAAPEPGAPRGDALARHAKRHLRAVRQGHADEVAVYDRALPASTIAQHYQAGRGQQAAAGSRPYGARAPSALNEAAARRG